MKKTLFISLIITLLCSFNSFAGQYAQRMRQLPTNINLFSAIEEITGEYIIHLTNVCADDYKGQYNQELANIILKLERTPEYDDTFYNKNCPVGSIATPQCQKIQKEMIELFEKMEAYPPQTACDTLEKLVDNGQIDLEIEIIW